MHKTAYMTSTATDDHFNCSTIHEDLDNVPSTWHSCDDGGGQ